MDSQNTDNITLSKTESIDSDIHIQNNNYIDTPNTNNTLNIYIQNNTISENMGDNSIEEDITYIHNIINDIINNDTNNTYEQKNIDDNNKVDSILETLNMHETDNNTIEETNLTNINKINIISIINNDEIQSDHLDNHLDNNINIVGGYVEEYNELNNIQNDDNNNDNDNDDNDDTDNCDDNDQNVDDTENTLIETQLSTTTSISHEEIEQADNIINSLSTDNNIQSSIIDKEKNFVDLSEIQNIKPPTKQIIKPYPDINKSHENLFLNNTPNISLSNALHNIEIYDHKNQLPKILQKSSHNVTFTKDDLNEIKLINSSSMPDIASTTNSTSELSYINQFQKTGQDERKLNRHIRQSKPKKKQSPELDDIDYIYNRLQDFIRNIKIDRTNYSLLITKCVEIVENMRDAHDLNRKQICTKAINRIIMIDLNLSEFDHRYFMANIDNFIELVIHSSKTRHNVSTRKLQSLDNEDVTKANSGQIVYSLLDKLITIIIKKRYNIEKIFTNLGTFAIILLTFCEKYGYLTGVEKKNIVLQTINLLIYKKLEFIIELTNEKKLDLINGLDVLPMAVDIFIALQKGKFRINKKQIIPTRKTFFNFLCCGSSNKDNSD
jgi:hypothetical protein